MSEPLYDALALCLEALERGESLEACLARYPQFAGELRPILQMAQSVRTGSAIGVPGEAARRGRARVLRRAGELREAQSASQRSWFIGRAMRLAALSLTLLAFTIAGGTGLVSASSGSIPGDHLYAVKRTWEGLRLQFTFSNGERESLEESYDHERLEEIDELFKAKRVAGVNFAGVLEFQSPSQWTVAGIPVAVNPATQIDAQFSIGDLIQVSGETQSDGSVVAERISAFVLLLPQAPFTATPRSAEGGESTVTDDHKGPGEDHGPDATKDQPDANPTPKPTKDRDGGSDNSGSGGGDDGGGDDNGGGDDH